MTRVVKKAVVGMLFAGVLAAGVAGVAVQTSSPSSSIQASWKFAPADGAGGGGGGCITLAGCSTF
jgi:hypothetical protein